MLERKVARDFFDPPVLSVPLVNRVLSEVRRVPQC